MHILVNAEADGSDGPYGRVTRLIINPINLQVTHLVVAERAYPYLKRLVPVQLIWKSTSEYLYLKCTKKQLATLRPFSEIE